MNNILMSKILDEIAWGKKYIDVLKNIFGALVTLNKETNLNMFNSKATQNPKNETLDKPKKTLLIRILKKVNLK